MPTSTNDTPRRSPVCPTGIPGLDEVLFGGIMHAGFYLVQGDPGSGKSTFALQFARACIERGESILYVTVTESIRDLELSAGSHGWRLDGIEICDLSRADQSPDRENTLFSTAEMELGHTINTILKEIERAAPRNVVFDGIGELRMLAGDAYTYRRQMLALKHYLEDHKITALLLDDRTNPFGEVQPETVVGGNIVLEKWLPGYGGSRRRLHVTKVRGADFRSGYHDYEIITGRGLVVHPRLISARPEERYEREDFQSGLPELDQMLGGGLTSGTTALLVGSAGVGKSTTAMQFVVNAAKKGYRSVVYTFDEVLDTLFDRTEKLCDKGIRGYVESGIVHARQVNPAELSPGAFAQDVRVMVRDHGARIVVIDSLNGYISAMPEERFLQTHLHELFAYLNELGILSIMVVAQHGVLSPAPEGIAVSYLADTALLLRYYEDDGEIKQAISVFKKRTGQHERTLRQLTITPTGLVVGDRLVGMRGILTGVPEYVDVDR
jgi:circadian clock protein KaiC